MIRNRFDSLPRGTRRAVAQDIGIRYHTMVRAIFGYVENEKIMIKVSIWLGIMGMRPHKPSYRENLEAMIARRYVTRLLIQDPLSSVLVRDIIGFVITEAYMHIAGLTNQRLYAIIASNYPLEEHISGEAVIGYRMRGEGEGNDE